MTGRLTQRTDKEAALLLQEATPDLDPQIIEKAALYLQTSGWIAALNEARTKGPEAKNYAPLTWRNWERKPKYNSRLQPLISKVHGYYPACQIATAQLCLPQGALSQEEIVLISQAANLARAERVRTLKTVHSPTELDRIFNEKIVAIAALCRDDKNWYRLRPAVLEQDPDLRAVERHRYGTKNNLGKLLVDPQSTLTDAERDDIANSHPPEVVAEIRAGLIDKIQAVHVYAQFSGDPRVLRAADFYPWGWHRYAAHTSGGFLSLLNAAGIEESDVQQMLKLERLERCTARLRRQNGSLLSIAQSCLHKNGIDDSRATALLYDMFNTVDPVWLWKIVPEKVHCTREDVHNALERTVQGDDEPMRTICKGFVQASFTYIVARTNAELLRRNRAERLIDETIVKESMVAVEEKGVAIGWLTFAKKMQPIFRSIGNSPLVLLVQNGVKAQREIHNPVHLQVTVQDEDLESRPDIIERRFRRSLATTAQSMRDAQHTPDQQSELAKTKVDNPSSPVVKRAPGEPRELSATEINGIRKRLLGKVIHDNTAGELNDDEIIDTRFIRKQEEKDLIYTAQNGSSEKMQKLAYDTIYIGLRRLIYSVARKYPPNGFIDIDDLAQEGAVGLMGAIEKFDFSKGTRLSTFAMYRINKYINRAHQTQKPGAPLPAYIAEQGPRILRAQNILELELGRAPTYEEIGERAESKPNHVRRFLESFTISLDDPVKEDSGLTKKDQLIAPDTTSTAQVDTLLEKLGAAVKLHDDPKRNEELWTIIIEHLGLHGNDKMSFDEIGKKRGVTRQAIQIVYNRSLRRIRDSEIAASLLGVS